MTITMSLGCCDYTLTTVSGSESPLKVCLYVLLTWSLYNLAERAESPLRAFVCEAPSAWIFYFLRCLHVTFCAFIQVSVQTALQKESFDFPQGK